MSEPVSGYASVTTETATEVVDALADLAQRSIRSSRSLWQIVSAPYGTSDPSGIVSANFERASAIARLGAGEARAQIDATQRLSEMAVAQTMKIRDVYVNSMRNLLAVGFSNLAFVREAAASPEIDRAPRFDVFTSPSNRISSN